MSWLNTLLKRTNPIDKKAMDFQSSSQNKYLQELVDSMINKSNIKLSDDSRSFVEDGYGSNIGIYTIINYIITTASNVPFKAQIMEGDQWVDDNESEIIKLLRNPNPLTNYSLFIEELLGWKLIDGSSYTYAPKLENGVNKGKTKELWVMPSTNMQIVGGGIKKPIEGFRYSQWKEMIPTEDVMYLRYFNPVSAVDNLSGSLVGMSPLRAAVLTAKKSNSAAVAGVSAYENNGAMGVISQDSNQWGDFTEEQAKQLDAAWQKSSGGASNYNKLKFTPGNIKFDRLNMSPADLRLGESELQSFRQLASTYKFPTQLANDSDGATFSNQNEAQKSVYTNTIIPEMRGIGEGLVNWLGEAYYPEQEIRIIPDTSNIEVLQPDKEAQALYLSKVDWLTQNEKRKIMDMGEDPDPKMDDYLIPNGKTFSKDLDLLSEINGTEGE